MCAGFCQSDTCWSSKLSEGLGERVEQAGEQTSDKDAYERGEERNGDERLCEVNPGVARGAEE